MVDAATSTVTEELCVELVEAVIPTVAVRPVPRAPDSPIVQAAAATIEQTGADPPPA